MVTELQKNPQTLAAQAIPVCNFSVTWRKKVTELQKRMIGGEQNDMKALINLNDVVKVKLTDYGKDVFRHQHDDLNEYLTRKGKKSFGLSEPVDDEEGYTEMQLWHFMQVFGEHIGMAKENVIMPITLIDTEAEIVE